MNKEKKINQLRITYKSLQTQPKTMKMVEVETGIDRSNICRYVAYLEKIRAITVIESKPCKITKHIAKYYSTNTDLFPPETQTNLFKREKLTV